MGKRKTKKQDFAFLNIPAELLAMRNNMSTIEKLIIADVGHFNGNGYRGYMVSNTDMAEKFGVSRRAIINAIQRLKAHKLRPIIDVGSDKYHRCLKLNGEISELFGGEISEGLVKKFQKPTAEQVSEYAISIGFVLDGQYFIDTYEARGWMIGKNKMKDWKATVRTWKKRERRNNGNSSKAREHSEPAYADIR